MNKTVIASKHGFTLIEMSIALVIIALVVGGIVVGKELLITAKINQQISQIQSINTAVNSFKLKYNCLPGECATATSLGLGTTASWHNGNNDGKIDVRCIQRQFYNANNLIRDSNNFFMHLANAGLLDGTFEGYQGEAHNDDMTSTMVDARYLKAKYNTAYIFPTRFPNVPGACSAGGDWTAYTRDGGNGFAIASYDTNFTSVIPKDEMRRMDEKMDDGIPISGNVGVSFHAGAMTQITAAGAPYSTCVGATYHAVTNPLCIDYKAVFVNQY